MPRLHSVGNRTSQNSTTGAGGVGPHVDLTVPPGPRLERARDADQAWRRARSRPVQSRLDLAFGTQALGQWLALSSFWVLALLAWVIAFGCCLISLCGFELEPLLTRAFLSPVTLPGLALVLTVAAGLFVAFVGRCRRLQILRWARRHSIDVDDPGDPPLPAFQS